MIIKDFIDKNLTNFSEIRLYDKGRNRRISLSLKDFIYPQQEWLKRDEIKKEVANNKSLFFEKMKDYVKEDFGKYRVINFRFIKLPNEESFDSFNLALEIWF